MCVIDFKLEDKSEIKTQDDGIRAIYKYSTSYHIAPRRPQHLQYCQDQLPVYQMS